MKRTISECSTCGQTITAEEVEVGLSLSCPWCETSAKEAKLSPDKKGPGGAKHGQQVWKRLLSSFCNLRDEATRPPHS